MGGIFTTAITAIVSGVVGALIAALIKTLKGNHAKQRAIMSGLQSMLRGEIVKQHEKYTERGYCPVYAKDALTRQYESYHDLGGNGVITELYHEIMELPEIPRKNTGV